MSPLFEVLSSVPFRVRRRVEWGECDPAGVVYTPRFADYVAETYLEFAAQLIGRPLHQRLQALEFDLPAKAMSLVFKQSLWPDDIFEVTVKVGALRIRTFDLSFWAATPDGGAVFEATLSPICVRPATRESIPIPDVLREQLQSYRDAVP